MKLHISHFSFRSYRGFLISILPNRAISHAGNSYLSMFLQHLRVTLDDKDATRVFPYSGSSPEEAVINTAKLKTESMLKTSGFENSRIFPLLYTAQRDLFFLPPPSTRLYFVDSNMVLSKQPLRPSNLFNHYELSPDETELIVSIGEKPNEELLANLKFDADLKNPIYSLSDLLCKNSLEKNLVIGMHLEQDFAA